MPFPKTELKSGDEDEIKVRMKANLENVNVPLEETVRGITLASLDLNAFFKFRVAKSVKEKVIQQ